MIHRIIEKTIIISSFPTRLDSLSLDTRVPESTLFANSELWIQIVSPAQIKHSRLWHSGMHCSCIHHDGSSRNSDCHYHGRIIWSRAMYLPHSCGWRGCRHLCGLSAYSAAWGCRRNLYGNPWTHQTAWRKGPIRKSRCRRGKRHARIGEDSSGMGWATWHVCCLSSSLQSVRLTRPNTSD